MVLLGDSIVAGHPYDESILEGGDEFNPPGTLAYYVEQTYEGPVLNRATGGSSCKGVLSHFEESVVAENPDLVILGCGLNDIDGGVVPFDTMGELLTRLSTLGIPTFVMSTGRILKAPQYDATILQFNEWLREQVTGFGFKLWDYDAWAIANRDTLVDGKSHPLREGYFSFAEFVGLNTSAGPGF